MQGWKKGLVMAAGCLSALAVAQDEIGFRIEGVSNEPKTNLESYLGKLTPDDLQNWRDTQSRLRKAAREAMESVGYYQSRIRFTQQGNQVLVNVEPGEPVHISHLELRYRGDAGNDIAFTALLETLPLAEGDVFHHGRYESMKSLVQNMALERGYFDAEWSVHEVKVLQPQQTAEVRLEFNSGPRYQFGDVTYRNVTENRALPLEPRWLESLTPIEVDSPYEASKIIELNKALLDSRYFNEVRVRAEPDLAQDRRVPVNVLLAADKPNQLDVGLGYATDIGARVSLAWRRPLLNARGHSIESSTEVSGVRQSATFRYGIPWSAPAQ